jgi:NAD(P)-dependent dehydrogenase (short-subunit alcohol dehydrogenase family)
LIIGGSSGIGLATAKAAIVLEAFVTIGSFDQASLKAAAKEISNPGLSAVTVDTFDSNSIEALFAKAEPYHHVVVTAAWSRVGSLHGLSLEDAYKAMDSKFWGSYERWRGPPSLLRAALLR